MSEDATTMPLRVGTYNLFNTTGRYLEGRRELLLDAVDSLEADVLGLQELAFGPGQPWAQDQVEDLKQRGWQVAAARLSHPIFPWNAANDEMFRIDGNAIAVRSSSGLSLIEGTHAVLEFTEQSLSGSLRCANRVVVQITDSHKVCVVNTHLHWAEAIEPSQADADLRARQVAELLEFAQQGADGLPFVLLGDFNFYQKCEPGYDEIIKSSLESAYKNIHGKETVTCPTPLEASTIINQWADEPSLASDYIFVQSGEDSPRVSVTKAEIGASSTQPAQADSTLYPSDHYAVVAELAIPPTVVCF